MSRTYRRKGLNHFGTNNSFEHEVQKEIARWDLWYTTVYVRLSDAHGITVCKCRTCQKILKYKKDHTSLPRYKKMERRFHTDRRQYRYSSIPSWFCNLHYYRPERASMRDQIAKAMRCESWEAWDDVDLFADIHSDLCHDWY